MITNEQQAQQVVIRHIGGICLADSFTVGELRHDLPRLRSAPAD